MNKIKNMNRANKKLFQNSIYLLVAISFMAISFLPLTNSVRADSFTQTYTNQIDFSNWTLSGVDKESISGSLVLSQQAGGNYGSYSTTDISKKDTSRTNATWESDGDLTAASASSTDLRSKLSELWGEYPGAGISSIAQGGGKIYIGGLYYVGALQNTNYSFGTYDPSANTYSDLTSKISWLSSNKISAMAWDSTNNVLHVLGSGGNWSIYNPSTNTASTPSGAPVPETDDRPPIPAPTFNAAVFNSSDGKTYAAGDRGNFWAYNPANGSITSMASSSGLSAFWSTSTIYSLAHISSGNIILIGGVDGKLAKFNVGSGSATDLTSDLGWGASGVIFSLAKDNAGIVYVSGNTTGYGNRTSGKIATFDLSDNSTATIQTGLTNAIRSATLDSANNTLYFGGYSAYLSKYIVGSSSYSAIDNSGAGFVSGNTGEIIKNLIFDSSNSRIYYGNGIPSNFGESGTSSNSTHWFGYFNGSFNNKSSVVKFSENTYNVSYIISDVVNENMYVQGYCLGCLAKYDITTNSVSAISGDLGFVNKMVFDPNSNFIYTSSPSKYFVKYNVSNSTYSDLSGSLGWTNVGSINMARDPYSIMLVGTDRSSNATKSSLYDISSNSFATVVLPWSTTSSAMHITTATTSNEFFVARSDAQAFYKYSVALGSFTNLTSLLPASFVVSTMNYNSYDESVYMGSSNGRFVKYNVISGVVTEFTSALSSFWGSTSVDILSFDNIGNIVYMEGGYSSGVVGRVAQYDPELGTATDLSSYIASWGDGDFITAVAFDSSRDYIYFGGTSGRFQKYILGSSQIKTSTLSSSNIRSAFLSVEPSSPEFGKAKYYVSNDGGVNFSELTSSSPAAFSASGDDFQAKAVLTNEASVSAPVIAYNTAVVSSGIASFIFSSLSKRVWQSFTMDSAAPSGSSIVASYRTADTQNGLSLQSFVETSGTLAGTSKYIEFSIQLIASGGASPILRDFQLVYQAEAANVTGASSSNTTAALSASPSPSASTSPSPGLTSSPQASPTGSSQAIPSVSPSASATSMTISASPKATPASTISPNKTGAVSVLINIPETITENSSDKYISIVQGALKDKGYLITITKEGIFDDNTKNAVATLQKDNGINPLKIIGPRSKALLNDQPIYVNLKRVSLVQGKEILSHKFSQDFKFGNQDDEISVLQKVLYVRSFFFGPFSGYFGPLTKSAVEEFQKSYGLNISGQLDKNTRDKLNSL